MSAQPPDALGVKAVGGLVEHEHRGVAQQHRRQAQPLAHPQRVAAGPLAGRAGQADLVEQLPRPGCPVPRRRGRARADGRARCGQGAPPWRRAAHRPSAPDRPARRNGGPDEGGSASGRISPSSARSVVVFPAPLGPRKPGDAAVGGGEGQAVDGHRPPESLGQPGHLDGRAVLWRAALAAGRAVCPRAPVCVFFFMVPRSPLAARPARRPGGHFAARLWPAARSTLSSGPAAGADAYALVSRRPDCRQPTGARARWRRALPAASGSSRSAAAGGRLGRSTPACSCSLPGWAGWPWATCGTATARSSTPWTWLSGRWRAWRCGSGARCRSAVFVLAFAAGSISPLAAGAALVAICTAASRVRGRALIAVALLAAAGSARLPARQSRLRGRYSRLASPPSCSRRSPSAGGCTCAPGASWSPRSASGQQLEADQQRNAELAREARAAPHRPGDARRAGPPAVAAQRARRGAGVPAGRARREIAQAAAVIRTSASAALGDLREVITVLRDDARRCRRAAPARLGQLAGLMEESRSAGMIVQAAHRRAWRRRCPPSAGRTAYRVVQEGADQRAQARARRARRRQRHQQRPQPACSSRSSAVPSPPLPACRRSPVPGGDRAHRPRRAAHARRR